MSNPLDPALMSVEERLDEAARILAVGLLRLRQKEKDSSHRDLRDYPMDFSPGRSVHAATPKRRKAAR